MKIFLGTIRSNFVTGILTFLPLGGTAYLVYFVVVKVRLLLLYITPEKYSVFLEHPHFGWLWQFLTLCLAIFLFTCLGFFAKMYLGRKILELSDELVKKIPLVNKVYKLIKQISLAFLGAKSQFFTKVVCFEYPRRGCYAIGFFTGYAQGELVRDTKMVNLFVPTTPNPTSGFFLMVPENDLTFLKMSPEDAMKIVISGGAYSLDEDISFTKDMKDEKN
ncbi:hypothetical protein AB834_06675 [PVC group bacterium (ex Bugula neritina AB1)]|nr:hypothetical protein AB834_06675 [PVC group bacterium (ex Bugula neritina AB1)]